MPMTMTEVNAMYLDFLSEAEIERPVNIMNTLTGPQEETLTRAIHRVWSTIQYDVCAEFNPTSIEAMETTLDADHLTMIAGSPEADDILDGLIAEYGYDEVLRQLAARYRL